MDTTESAKPVAPAVPDPRLDEVVGVLKVELVNAGIGTDERKRGFNPYDGRLGRANRDVWGNRKRV